MIGFIKGTLKNFAHSSIVLLTESGVGYEIEFQNFNGKELGDLMEVWVYTNVRENEIKLFGFQNLDSKKMFELLITISGVGPKIAHLIVSALNVSEIQSAILLGEGKTFTKLPGVGKKVSERIIMELKEKIDKTSFDNVGMLETQDDLVDSVNVSDKNIKETFEALTMLGYTSESIRDALKGEDTTLPSKELIKICLKKIRN